MRFARWSRVTVAVLVLAVFCRRRNLAGQGIRQAQYRAALPGYCQQPISLGGKDHSLLVDGDREDLGFHTGSGGQQWVVIDLGWTGSSTRWSCTTAPMAIKRAVPLN